MLGRGLPKFCWSCSRDLRSIQILEMEERGVSIDPASGANLVLERWDNIDGTLDDGLELYGS